MYDSANTSLLRRNVRIHRSAEGSLESSDRWMQECDVVCSPLCGQREESEAQPFVCSSSPVCAYLSYVRPRERTLGWRQVLVALGMRGGGALTSRSCVDARKRPQLQRDMLSNGSSEDYHVIGFKRDTIPRPHTTGRHPRSVPRLSSSLQEASPCVRGRPEALWTARTVL